MPHRSGPPPRQPLDSAGLERLALAYVGRFATSRARLRDYLGRKLRERGWAGDGEPPVAALVERLAGRGYVDDHGYALAKARSLLDRGYGPRRVSQRLRSAGIGGEDGSAALVLAEVEEAEAALRFARRRRIGPWAPRPADQRQRDRWVAALVRGGHRLALARRIAAAAPGTEIAAPDLTDSVKG